MGIEHLLIGWPVAIEQAIQWGEMDAFKHVNNVVYFRYFENARIAFMARLGWPETESQSGIGIILGSVKARFRKPLTWPDTVSITARAVDVLEDRFTLQHHVISHIQEAVTTEGEGVVVTFDYAKSRKAPMPDSLRQRIATLSEPAE